VDKENFTFYSFVYAKQKIWPFLPSECDGSVLYPSINFPVYLAASVCVSPLQGATSSLNATAEI
jgi:hypothetical protein